MYKFILFLLVFGLSITLSAQDIFGKWKSIDDETGEEKSIVEIYKKDGKVFGKIINVLRPKGRGALCTECKGVDYNKPVLGLEIIKNLVKDGKYFKNGTVFDPENGNEYNCKIWIDNENPNKLNVRGYMTFFYRTQYWKRIIVIN